MIEEVDRGDRSLEPLAKLALDARDEELHYTRRCRVARRRHMTPIEKIRAEFDELSQREPEKWNDGSNLHPDASAWLIEALALIEAVFPTTHATTRTMAGAIEFVLENESYGEHMRTHMQRLSVARSTFRAAKTLVDGDRLRGLIDIVKAETETELLGQADDLLDGGSLVGAAVLAGGALETHLRTLIDRHQITVKGNPGLGSYNNSIASFRKANPNAGLYPAAMGEMVDGWTKMRNKAAHEPLDYPNEFDEKQTRSMIGGVRDFLGRFP